MNINAKELLLLNKKIQFKESINPSNNQETSNSVKPEELEPQTGLNKLMFQGLKNVATDPQLSQKLGMFNNINTEEQSPEATNNYIAPYKSNIAFQGLNGNKIKSIALGALMGLATLGATSSLTSCVDVKQDVVVDMDAITEMMSKMTEILNQIKDQNASNNELLTQMNTYMLQLIEEVKNGNISADEFYNKMFEYMVANQTNQELIINQLVQNGKTQEEANQLIQQLIKDVNSGFISAEEAWDTIQKLLGEIKDTLDDMNAKLTTLINEFQAYRTEYTNDKKEEFKKLDQLIQDNRIQTAILDDMKEAQKGMAENLEGLKANSDTLLTIAKDDTRHKELIEAIKNVQAGGGNSTEIDYDKLEAMFEAMGIKISDAINMSSKELEQAIRDFQTSYVKNEAEQTELMASINEKLENISNFQGLNKDEIINAIDKVTSAVNSNSANIVDEIKNLEAQIEKLQATVDAMFKAFGEYTNMVNKYFSMFDAKFDSVLNSLDKIDTDMDQIIANQTIANKYLENLNNSVEDLKVQINEIKVIIEGNEGGSGSGITLEQLEKLLKERDEANFEKYKELLENLNIKVDIDTSTIEDLLKEIDEKMNIMNENNKILQEILDLLKGIDWSHPDYSAKLDEIIEILKSIDKNCSSCNEGILGDLEDTLGR